MVSTAAGDKGGWSRAAAQASSRVMGKMALFFIDVMTE
jgi:hypothetical protein